MLRVDLIEHLLAACPRVNHLLLALSGGVDSTVLLHLLVRRREVSKSDLLSAIYIHHGLHEQASDWDLHCRELCLRFEVAYRSLRVDAAAACKQSPEQAAREARYAALARETDATTALLTAHHQDDQAETVLLQLLRGAGPHGLAAMPAAGRFGKGFLLRPLLGVPRRQIVEYAHAHALNWIDDSSNTDQRLRRNFLRHAIIPRLKQVWPGMDKTLTRAARLCADASLLLDELAAQDLKLIACTRPNQVKVSALRGLTRARQSNVLRYWLRALKLPVAQAKQLERVLHDLVASEPDASALVRWPGCEVRRYRDRLYALSPRSARAAGVDYAWAGEKPLHIPGIGTVALQPVFGQGLRADVLRHLRIAFRRGGERIKPLGHKRRKRLKTLLQEAAIPPWERDRIPLLFGGARLLAVADLWLDADCAAGAGEKGWIFTWQRDAASDIV